MLSKAGLCYDKVKSCAENTGVTCYVISLELLTSFSKDKLMDSLVETVTDLLSEYLWNFVTEPLVPNGMERALWVLKALLKCVIKKMLIYVIGRMA